LVAKDYLHRKFRCWKVLAVMAVVVVGTETTMMTEMTMMINLDPAHILTRVFKMSYLSHLISP